MAKRGPKKGSQYSLKPHDTITEGDSIGVLLSNRPDRVWVDKVDYDRIVGLYRTKAWTWIEATRYVQLQACTAKGFPVARLVLDSDAKGRVAFANGDRLDLRRANLSVKPHAGKRWVPKRLRALDEEVAPKLPREPRTPRRPREKVQPELETQPNNPTPTLPKPPPVFRPLPKREPVPSSFMTRVQPNSAVATVRRGKVL